MLAIRALWAQGTNMRIPTLEPVWDSERQRFRLSVPAPLAPGGKRRRLFFETKEAATSEAARLLRTRRHHGTEAVVLPAATAIDAVKALKLLEPSGATLAEAAKFYADHKAAQAASESLAKAFETFIASREAEGASDHYIRDLQSRRDRLAKWHNRLMVDLDESAVQAMLSVFKGPTSREGARRILRAVWNDSIRRKKARENPVKNVRPSKKAGSDHDIRLLSLAETKAIFAACRDWRERPDMAVAEKKLLPRNVLHRQDCRDAGVCFAFLLFSGLRPQELEQLDWSDVDLEEGIIRLDGAKTKTRHRRFIPIEENLRIWIGTVPEEEREGGVCPAGWRRKRIAVRAIAGIPSEGTVTRHTYASAWLSLHGDVNALRAHLGHGETATLFRHYAKAMRKKDSLAYFSIVPDGLAKPAAIRRVS